MRPSVKSRDLLRRRGALWLAGAVSIGCAGAPPPAEPAAAERTTPPAKTSQAVEETPTPTPEPDAAALDELAASSKRPKQQCPRPDHAPHCVWIATSPPNPTRARHVAARMKKDGLDAVADGDRIIVHAADQDLTRLFDRAPSHELRAASASDRFVCVASYPEDARLSAKYAGEVGAWVMDDPTCEM